MSRALRVLWGLGILGWTMSATAQAPARKPRTLSGGVCGTTHWVCVAECIDAACVDLCMHEGCEQALERLRACTEKAGCAPEDSACSARQCGGTCQRAFEPAPRSPEKEKPRPCEGFQIEGGGPVPRGEGHADPRRGGSHEAHLPVPACAGGGHPGPGEEVTAGSHGLLPRHALT